MPINIKKIDGSLEPFMVEKINQAIINASVGLPEQNAKAFQIAKETELTLYDGVSTKELDQALISASVQNIKDDPDFDIIAKRLLLKTIYKEVLGDFSDPTDLEAKHRLAFKSYIKKGIDGSLLAKNLEVFNLDELADSLKIENDSLLTYTGLSTVKHRYLIKGANQNLLETPQFFWMRVAMGLAFNEKQATLMAKSFYEKMSRLEYVPGGSTNINAGTAYTLTQLSSGTSTTVTPNAANVITGPGFDINVTNIGIGDRYNINPTLNAAKNMSTLMTDPTLIAAAATNGYSKAANVFQINGVNIGAVAGGTNPLTQGINIAAAINSSSIPGVTAAADPVTGAITLTSAAPLIIAGDISETGLSTGTTPGTVVGIAPPTLTANQGDNTNALAMALLSNKGSFNSTYTQLITNVGNVTQSASLNSTAQQAALAQATATQQSLSGVNLDEEAANLIKYQQAYQASSKAISIAQSLFTTLIGALQ